MRGKNKERTGKSIKSARNLREGGASPILFRIGQTGVYNKLERILKKNVILIASNDKEREGWGGW